MTDTLNGDDVRQWTGSPHDFFSGVRVNGAFYLLMGSPNQASWNAGQVLPTATQTGVVVWSTQTIYSFSAGGVNLNLTFTSPLIASDLELLSRPASYVTLDVAASDAATHTVSWYFDVSPRAVMQDGNADVSFTRVPLASVNAEALSLGATVQTPLASTNDKMEWGFTYLVRDTSVSNAAVLRSSTLTRASFFATGTLPPTDDPLNPQPMSTSDAPATGPQPNVDRSGNDMAGSPFVLPSADPSLCWAQCNKTVGCKAWAYAVPNCDGMPANCWLKSDFGTPSDNKCRVSGAQAGAPAPGSPTIVAATTYTFPPISSAAGPIRRMLVIAIDEIVGINWFGEFMPPYWRRALPVNDSTVIPTAMLSDAFNSYVSVKIL